MTDQNLGDERLPAIGHPGEQPDETPPRDEQQDFAGEHADTAVDEDIVTGADGEEESPHGWSGLER
jgi:hypothetical protein